MKPKKPLFTLLVLNWNGKDKLKSMLDSFRGLNLGVPYEIIVVDNASTDSSAEMVRKNYKYAKLIVMKKNIGTAAFNYAISKARGDYTLHMGNDMRIDRKCLKNALKLLKDENVAAVVPKLVRLQDKKTVDFGGELVSRSLYSISLEDQKEADRKKETLSAGCAIIKKDVLNQIGGLYDKDYFLYGEDIDNGLRIRMTGKKAVYDPSCMLYHDESITTKIFPKPRLVYLTERNLLTTVFKIYSLHNLLWAVPYSFLLRILMSAKDLVLLRPLIVLARLRALLWIFLNIPYLARKHIEAQKIRKAPDSYVFALCRDSWLITNLFK